LSSARNDWPLAQFGRFSIAGVVNTSLGYAVIFGGLALGLSPYVSNLSGYLVGLTCSFFLTKTFVFAARGESGRQARRFLVAFAVAYLMNLGALHASLQAEVNGILAQLLAGALYLFSMFIFSRSWVFRD
jgi:putative flippase GtrA